MFEFRISQPSTCSSFSIEVVSQQLLYGHFCIFTEHLLYYTNCHVIYENHSYNLTFYNMLFKLGARCESESCRRAVDNGERACRSGGKRSDTDHRRGCCSGDDCDAQA